MDESPPNADSFSFWDALLEYIDEHSVIPIIGPELLQIEHEGRSQPFLRVCAARLATRLGMKTNDLPEEDALNYVACHYLLERHGAREDIYAGLRTALRDFTPAIPEALRKLARIRHFKLFVSTTFDTLLEQALEAERPGEGKAESLAYAPSEADDISDEMKALTRPTVYHLLGKLSALPNYVVTDEDMLEFVHSMQSEATRPKMLFDELKRQNLLIIGSNFPDWLARFFIRIAKGDRLSASSGQLKVLASRREHDEKTLVVFLRNFSKRTEIFPGSALDFVNELSTRYLQRHSAEAAPKPAPTATGNATTGAADDMAPGAVFLSYAHEDLETVERLRDALAKVGIDTWFDQKQLDPGDAFNPKIRWNIRNCSLFVPLISDNTQQRLSGYFRLEWNLAAEHSLQFDPSMPFLLPVVLGGIKESEALVPERMQGITWSRLVDGVPTPELIARIVKLVRSRRKQEKKPA